MAHGPGKYDDACTAARESTQAEGVVLIVLRGDRGNGMSVQTDSDEVRAALPALLEYIAGEIRRGAH